MPGIPEKDIFDKEKSYKQVRFIKDRPILDFELNEAQDILREEQEANKKDVFGSGPIGDGFKAVPSTTPNQILVHPGTFYDAGVILRSFAFDTITSTSGTALNGRIDVLVVDYSLIEVDASGDPDIVSPTIGAETAIRKKLLIEFSLIEGADSLTPSRPIIPDPASGVTRIPLAEIDRPAGKAEIEASDITDERFKTRETYLIEGGRAYQIDAAVASMTAIPAHPVTGIADDDIIQMDDGAGLETLEVVIPPGTLTPGNIPINIPTAIEPDSIVKAAIISSINTTTLLDIEAIDDTGSLITLVGPPSSSGPTAVLSNAPTANLSISSFSSSAFVLLLEETKVRVADSEFSLDSRNLVIPSSTTRVYWVDEAGDLQFASALPTDGYKVPLFRVSTDATSIIELVDLRCFAPENQLTSEIVKRAAGTEPDFAESWFKEHNPDGTHAPAAAISGDITKSNVIDLRVDPITPVPSLEVYVNPGDFPRMDGTGTNEFPGGNSPSWAGILPPAGQYRIDLLVLTDTNALEIIQGGLGPSLAAAFPSVYPQDKTALAEISVNAGITEITNTEIRDVRGWVNSSFGFLPATGSRVTFLYGDQGAHAENDYAKVTDGHAGDVSYTMIQPGTVVAISYAVRNLPSTYSTLTAIVADPATGVGDADLLIIDDGTVSKTFEFDTDSTVTPGNFPIVIAPVDSAANVKAAIITAINAAGINVSAAPGPGVTIQLTGVPEANTITEVLANPVTLSPSNLTGGERVFLQKNGIDTTGFIDISNSGQMKASKEITDLNIRFNAGDCFNFQFRQDGIRPYSYGEDVSLTLYIAFDGFPTPTPRLCETQIAGPAPDNRIFDLITGSYTRANKSLMVFRNGKLLTEGDEYWERSPTRVETTYVLVEGDVMLFRVPKESDRDDGAPFLREIQIADGGEQTFDLKEGAYRPGLCELWVYRNGKLLYSGIDYLEISPTQIQLNGYTAVDEDVFQFIVV